MHFDRKAVYDGLKADFGPLDDVQLSVVNEIVAEFERRKLPDMRWLAYMLATAWHEARLKPLREIGRGKGRPYGKSIGGKIYYGRGLVQITWLENYRELGRILNLPLVQEPDMALLVPVAVAILFEGMTTALSAKGDFTGRDLSQYFNDTVDDPVNARRIINGTDRAKLIAGHHHKILVTLAHAVKFEPRVPEAPFPDPEEGDLKPPVVSGGQVGGAIVVASGGGAAVVANANGVSWWLLVAVAAVLLVAGLAVYAFIKKRSVS